jgi:hypothetical protein
MSQKRKHEIACPFCGREQEVELWDILHVDEEPELRDALLLNRINRVECAGCAKSFRVDKPLVVHDREQDLFIHFDPLVAGRTLVDAERTFREAMEELNRILPKDVPPPETHLVVEWANSSSACSFSKKGSTPASWNTSNT